MNLKTLDQQVIALTGSTGGLGEAAARALKAQGAQLILLDINPSALEAQVDALGGPQYAVGIPADVRSMDSMEAAMKAGAEHFGHIDVVIAGAGIGVPTPVETMNPRDFDAVIDINLTGVFRTFRAGLPFVKARKGYLLAVSSMAAFVHSPLNAHYAASKAGVWALCNSLRLELASIDVKVGSLHPTFFETPMMTQVINEPCSQWVWNGHTGIWKFAEFDSVIQTLVECVADRSELVTVPRSHAMIAKTPGLMRKMIERIGFKSKKVETAVRLLNERNRSQQFH